MKQLFARTLLAVGVLATMPALHAGLFDNSFFFIAGAAAATFLLEKKLHHIKGVPEEFRKIGQDAGNYAKSGVDFVVNTCTGKSENSSKPVPPPTKK